ncbi:helix-turn-helix domain-containing protein [Mycobacterium antarcticum]|uniref:helix-turn-helix domain-containing protein n=1 Tax=Mycolicibacterium sp. TUM20984 TaxID=3023368 RepID=UPI0024E092C0|nr:helix-turn-helix domain-containing protein [Mycolicibacterium sp. TUM20984]
MTANNATQLPPHPTLAQAADFWGVSQKSIRRWLAEGRLKGHRVGRQIRLDRESLLAIARPMGGAR